MRGRLRCGICVTGMADADLAAYRRTVAEIDFDIARQKVRLERVRQYRYQKSIDREAALLDVLLEERHDASA